MANQRSVSSLRLALLATAGSLVGLASLVGCGSDSASAPPPPGTGSTPGAGGAGQGTGGAGNPGDGGAPAGGANAGGASAGGDQGIGGNGQKVFFAGSDANRNDVPGGQVCDRIATIQCAGEAFCCDAPGRTFEDCKATMKQGCVTQLYLDAITGNPVAGYDQAGANAIFTEFERRASTCDTTVTAWGATVEGLRGLAKGTIASGASCMPPGTSITEKAVDAAYLAACTDPAGHACHPTLATWTCSPRGGDGQPCFTDTNCQDGLYCTNSSTSPSLTGGTCKQRKADGTSCALLNECMSLLCKQGQCVPANKQNAYCLNAN